MKDKESRHIATVDAFNVTDKGIEELTVKLNESDRDKKSAEATLEKAERQAENLRK